jgi:UDPglucose 6-dehydrogenase
MKITIFGTGYVGLVSAGCLVQKDHDVLCYDNNLDKIIQLNKGDIPIFEPGLDELIDNGFRSGRLLFTSSSDVAVKDADIIILCVGTPDDGTGATNLNAIESCALTISELATHNIPVLIKSTVPVGTCNRVQSLINNKLSDRQLNIKLTVASNPEFLHEGVAITEFFNPDRIVLGTIDEEVIEATYEMYKDVLPENNKILVMSPESSELTKYASNSFLATKISYINQLSQFASLTGANIDDVRMGMGPDPDISPGYLFAGCGFGGSCLPKDINSLIHQGGVQGRDFSILKAVRDVNEQQKKYLFSLAANLFNNDLKNKKVAIWGLAFKPKTDDMRGAPSLVVIENLLAAGAIVECYDPIVSFAKNDFELQNKSLKIKQDLYEITQNSDCLIICTEWSEFKNIDYKKLGSLMKRKLILDGRNILNPSAVFLNDFEYYDVGRVKLPEFNEINTTI